MLELLSVQDRHRLISAQKKLITVMYSGDRQLILIEFRTKKNKTKETLDTG